jgi:hypothetical protein
VVLFPTEVECDFAHWYPSEDLGAWHRGDWTPAGGWVVVAADCWCCCPG